MSPVNRDFKIRLTSMAGFPTTHLLVLNPSLPAVAVTLCSYTGSVLRKTYS